MNFGIVLLLAIAAENFASRYACLSFAIHPTNEVPIT